MAQQRFFNWKENDSTFLLSQRLAGYFVPGRYAGFDFSPTANMTLTLIHTVSGMDVRGYTGSPVKNGVVHTNQGVTILEDAAVTLPIGAVGGLPRIDLVVLTHSQTQNPGGALALYSVVQGTPGASPVKPAIPTPDTQLEIGYLYLPASVTALNQPGVIWTQSKVSALETKASFEDLNDIVSAFAEALGNGIYSPGTPATKEYQEDDGMPVVRLKGGYRIEIDSVLPGWHYLNGELFKVRRSALPDTGSYLNWYIVDEGGRFRWSELRKEASILVPGFFDKTAMYPESDVKDAYYFRNYKPPFTTITPLNSWVLASGSFDVITMLLQDFQVRNDPAERKTEFRGVVVNYAGAPATDDIFYTAPYQYGPQKKTKFLVSNDRTGTDLCELEVEVTGTFPTQVTEYRIKNGSLIGNVGKGAFVAYGCFYWD